MEDTTYKIRYNIPLAREITPIYRNPCKKCIVQACCIRPCRDKAIYESTTYWRKIKLQQIIHTILVIILPLLVISATIWSFK